MSQQTQEKQELEGIEAQITRFKKEADDTLSRFYSGPRSPQSFWKMRMEIARISLQNCQAIVRYVRKINRPAANELEMRRRSVATALSAIEKTYDLRRVNEWYKRELAPLLNKAEQAGYLVATTMRKSSGNGSDQFTWQLQAPIMEEHVKRFGKTAQQFKYLEQTCPICGSRIDEKGWCGCGTIGGG